MIQLAKDDLHAAVHQLHEEVDLEVFLLGYSPTPEMLRRVMGVVDELDEHCADLEEDLLYGPDDDCDYEEDVMIDPVLVREQLLQEISTALDAYYRQFSSTLPEEMGRSATIISVIEPAIDRVINKDNLR